MMVRGSVYKPPVMYSSLASRLPASRMRAVPWVRRIATVLSLASEKSWPGGRAVTSSWVGEETPARNVVATVHGEVHAVYYTRRNAPGSEPPSVSRVLRPSSQRYRGAARGRRGLAASSPSPPLPDPHSVRRGQSRL